VFDVTDAYCSNTANGTVTVTVNSLPSATISGGATLCADGSTAQIDINANGIPPYNIIYSDGFNNIALNGISSPYNFQTNTAGTYTLNSITDLNGCAGNVSGVAIIVVNPLPIASFSFMPQPVDINNPTVYFTDLSSGHVAGVYDFGDGITEPTMLGGQLSHTYLDTGSYQVLYSVTSIDGCIASVSHTIIIDPAFLIYIPTAFTPNRDGKNDVFIPIMMGIDEYNFYIYDRFGELIFETENQLEGWDGIANSPPLTIPSHPSN
jgi:gliding motility-associated-like protein